MTEVNGLNPDDTKALILSLENELARYSMSEKTPDFKQATRTCVYHILLRAITLSKDPTVSVEEIKRLFELAKETIAQAELGEEKDLQDRLDDLVNSLVDRSDISVQFANFTVTAQGYFDTISALITQEKELLAEDMREIQEGIVETNRALKSMGKSRSLFKIFTVAAISVLVCAVAFFFCTVIIVFVVSNNGAESDLTIKPKASIHMDYDPMKEPG